MFLRGALAALIAPALAWAVDLSPLTAPDTRWERGDDVAFIGDNQWVQGLYGFEDQLKWHLLKERSALAISWAGVSVGTADRLDEAFQQTPGRWRYSSIVALVPGYGDARSKTPAAELAGMYRSMADRLRERGALVLMATPPTAPRKTPGEQVQALAALAQAIRDAYGTGGPGLALADLYQAFSGAGKPVTDDDRFTQVGHDLAAEVLAKGLGELLSAAPMTVAVEGREFLEVATVPIGVRRGPDPSRVEIRYSLNGRDPDPKTGTIYRSPVKVRENSTLIAIATDKATGQTARAEARFQRAKARPSERPTARLAPGLAWEYLPGRWKSCRELVPGTGTMRGAALTPDFASVREDDQNPTPPDLAKEFGLLFTGWVTVPVDGVYRFSVRSDDGSRLSIGDTLVVDNDGQHGSEEKSGQIGLRAGSHPLTIAYFQGDGGSDLAVFVEGPGGRRQALTDLMLGYDPTFKPKPPPAPKTERK